MQMVMFMVRIDPKTKAALEKIRREEGIPMSFIVRVAIRDWLRKHASSR